MKDDYYTLKWVNLSITHLFSHFLFLKDTKPTQPLYLVGPVLKPTGIKKPKTNTIFPALLVYSCHILESKWPQQTDIIIHLKPHIKS